MFIVRQCELTPPPIPFFLNRPLTVCSQEHNYRIVLKLLKVFVLYVRSFALIVFIFQCKNSAENITGEKQEKNALMETNQKLREKIEVFAKKVAEVEQQVKPSLIF